MPSPSSAIALRLATLLVAAAVLPSCSSDPNAATAGPADEADATVDLHRWGGRSTCRKAADRYPTVLTVSADATPGDGRTFTTIGAALEAARAGRIARGELTDAACRITINVAPGVYQGSATEPAAGLVEHFPLVVDVPDITLRGALKVQLGAWGRATGDVVGTGTSTLAPVSLMPILNGVTIPIIAVNAHPGGSAGNGFVVEGFDFQSGHDPAVSAGGQGILSVRATGLVVRRNRFGAGFTESIDVRSGSAFVIQNALGGGAGTCDMCLAGPGHFSAFGNHLKEGGIPGILVAGMVNLPVPEGVEPLVPLPTAATWADVRNNEVRDHLRLPVGTGIRVDALGVGAPNVHNTVHAVIQGNLLANNRFGMIVHAAFPAPNTNLRSDVSVTLGGNQLIESCQAKLLVSFSRHTTTLGLSRQPYLLNSTFTLRLLRNLDWSEAWYGNPADLGNTLVVDGNQVPNGIVQAYDAVGCPAKVL